MTVSYDLAAMASKIIERVVFAVAREVPEVAPSLLFREHDDTTVELDQVTEPDRLRRFEVVFVGVEEDEEAHDAGDTLAYSALFKLRVGYTVGAFETIEDVSYKIAHLITHDFEQLDLVVRAEAIFAEIDAEHPAIEGFEIARLKGVGGSKRVKETLYQISYKRER